ncbi:unnamed protein product [Ceutorhynchus assimilis]|uniref:E3 ubiquitin-protein ligase n=1 Tax=Ceutorhynchus assimilis TaxID=467358 RepID=A0A9P0GRF0_9CUCU|nr:unnamed protein product [Ceutorhynchus assimilis]
MAEIGSENYSKYSLLKLQSHKESHRNFLHRYDLGNTGKEPRSIPESPVEIISPSLAILPSPDFVAEPMEVDDRTVAIPGDKTMSRQDKLERLALPSTSRGYRRRNKARKPPKNYPEDQPSVTLDESILSLLLKLHSKLSGIPDSFDPDDEEIDYFVGGDDTVPCGDGPFYVGKLLKKIAISDSGCHSYIQESRRQLWPSAEENEKAKRMRENKEREDRRRRAKDRQDKLMAEFAKKQNDFWKREKERMETDENSDSSMDESEIPISKEEYDCVICNTSSPSTEDKPMGLVVLIQATSVIGHRRRYGQPERSTLPTCDDEREQCRKDDTLSAEFDRRTSWFLSVNTGWDGGVHVQTCGHHLHLDCLNSYLTSLRSQQRQQTLSPEKGEYLCPLCRQLANSVLPLSPQYGDKSQMVRAKPNDSMLHILEEISDFLNDNDQKPSSSSMAEAIGKVMEDMTNSTQLKALFRPKSEKPIPQSLILFVNSIARTNLEVELVQRGGSLVSPTSDAPNPLLPKRDCIVPLLHVLAVHARVARSIASWPAWMSFIQLCGLPAKEQVSLIPMEREVPLLLKDPIALLLQFVLLLPLHLDQTYFTTTVKMVYNLLYYQVVAQISCGLTSAERNRAAKEASSWAISNICDSLGLIDECLGHTDLYMDDEDDGSESASSSEEDPREKLNVVALEQQYYHERPCNQCHSVATETSICLLCGTIVCLKQNCCKQQNVCEAVAHAQECGAGTGVFLVVTSTYIIVIRGHRACLWGSLYLDDFEEEDRDLNITKGLEFLENYLIGYDNYSDDQIKEVKHKFSYIKSEFKRRWGIASKKEHVFLEKNSEWLQENFEIPRAIHKTGRPPKTFDGLSERSKRRKTEEMCASVDSQMLTYATQVKLRCEGKRDVSKIVKEVTGSQTEAEKYKKAYSCFEREKSRITVLQALSMFVEANLSQKQYEIIISTAKGVFPCYSLLQKANKTAILPKSPLLLLIYLEEVLQSLGEEERKSSLLICKWGCDGSQQAQFKQKFESETGSDTNIFQSSFLPLQLICEVNKKIIWQNPTPSSPRYCRPIRIRFVKESVNTTKEEISYVEEATNLLEPTRVTLFYADFSVRHKMMLTMIDGKICNAATDITSTMKCYICGLTSKDFNNMQIN